MSENTPASKTKHQRRTEALERRKSDGYKVHDADPATLYGRKLSVLKSRKNVNDNNRIPKSARPDRLRSHGEVIGKRGLGKTLGRVAALSLVTIGSMLAIDRIAGDSQSPPHPGNMEQFSEDPLQGEYLKSPEDFEIRGGVIVYKTEEENNSLKPTVQEETQSMAPNPVSVDTEIHNQPQP